MIKDRIVWPPKFDPEKTKAYSENSIEVNGLTPEEIWPYLINISDWDRINNAIVSANFIDPSINDPHLFGGAEFVYKTDSLEIHARVLEAIPPKGDRPGRISYEAEASTINGDETPQTFDFVRAWLLGVPDKEGNFEVATAISFKGDGMDEFVEKNESGISTFDSDSFHGLMKLVGIREYTTNHPRKPSSGAMIP